MLSNFQKIGLGLLHISLFGNTAVSWTTVNCLPASFRFAMGNEFQSFFSAHYSKYFPLGV